MTLNSKSIVLFKEHVSNLIVNSNLARILARDQKILREKKKQSNPIENFGVILHMNKYIRTGVSTI